MFYNFSVFVQNAVGALRGVITAAKEAGWCINQQLHYFHHSCCNMQKKIKKKTVLCLPQLARSSLQNIVSKYQLNPLNCIDTVYSAI